MFNLSKLFARVTGSDRVSRAQAEHKASEAKHIEKAKKDAISHVITNLKFAANPDSNLHTRARSLTATQTISGQADYLVNTGAFSDKASAEAFIRANGEVRLWLSRVRKLVQKESNEHNEVHKLR